MFKNILMQNLQMRIKYNFLIFFTLKFKSIKIFLMIYNKQFIIFIICASTIHDKILYCCITVLINYRITNK